MKLRRYYTGLIICLILSACNTPLQQKPDDKKENYKNSFIDTNNYIRERNREQILAFTDRVGWDMTETSTGLWYEITRAGNGDPVQEGKMVYYAYETKLLNGKLCYAADTTTPKKVVVGKGNIEAGLEEGLLLLREGSKAVFIIPPYLAHGNFGDMDKIPGSAILLVEIEVMEVKR